MFTEDDTAAALALAEEERDTCPSCGMPKVWCRDPTKQFAFEAVEAQCHATWALAVHRNKVGERDDATRAAAQVSARFREGHEPDVEAGLGLGLAEGAAERDDGGDQHQQEH